MILRIAVNQLVRSLFFLMCVVCLGAQISGGLQAQEKADAGRWMTDGTLAAARVDLARMPWDNMEKRWFAWAPARATKNLRELGQTLATHGAQSALVLLDPVDLPAVTLVLECTSATRAQDIAERIQRDDPNVRPLTQLLKLGCICRADGNAVWIGKEHRSATDPATTQRQLTISQDALLELVLCPSADHRRVAVEMMPRLPAPFKDLNLKSVIQKAQYVAFAITSVDAPQLEIVATMQDAEGAMSAQRVASPLLEWLRSSPRIGPLQTIDQFAETVTLDQSEHRFVVRFPSDSLRAVLQESFGRMAEKSAIAQQVNQLKQLALGMHNFADAHGGLPPSASYDKNAKPLLSWRVYLLPFVDQDALYRQFHLDEPWDSPHNRTLIDKMPAIFSCPGLDLPVGKTVFQLPTGEGTIFSGRVGSTFQEILDGTSYTIMIVQTLPEHAVTWIEPRDVAIDMKDPWRLLASEKQSTINVAFGDGSVQRLNLKETTKERFAAMLTEAGGEKVDR